MWIIDNSNEIHNRITLINIKFRANEADTFDFSAHYTSIDQLDLKKVIAVMMKKAFSFRKRKYLTFNDKCAKLSKNESTSSCMFFTSITK